MAFVMREEIVSAGPPSEGPPSQGWQMGSSVEANERVGNPQLRGSCRSEAPFRLKGAGFTPKATASRASVPYIDICRRRAPLLPHTPRQLSIPVYEPSTPRIHRPPADWVS